MVFRTPHKRLSVVMPAYNAAGTIAAAINSVLRQTDETFELIVVDDGSLDETQRIIHEFQTKDPRVRCLPLPHTGIVAAINAGIQAANGHYIVRMDADDIMLPKRLHLQRSFLDTHPNVGLVGSRVEFGGNRGQHLGYAMHVDWINSLITPHAIALNRFVESPFAHPSVAFRRELVDAFGGYRDGNFPEDYELWLRWMDKGVRMAKCPETLMVWHDPPKRLSRTDPRYAFRAFYHCKAKYLARWLERINPHHPKLIVWGAGRETRKRAEYLTQHGIDITAYIDIDPRKIDQSIAGRPVLANTDIPPPDSCFVASYVASRGARADIRQRLRDRGFTEGNNFIMAA
ncbi:MAG: glycosyltransferase [Candidatus Pacebacteria bacterium]|nr:glycosyltransferase [Candidatus Paceibacterota bacterium]